MASVSWAYAEDQLIALRQQNAAADAAAPVATGVDINALNFRYRIEGDNPAWRPLRAFDDGRQVFIEFPSGISQGELPPLWVIGAEGDGQLVNYRVKGNHMIVDRLFAAAELKLGGKHQQVVRIVRTDGRPQLVTDAPHEDDGPSAGRRPTEEMRLRSSRPPVTRLSRKVLLGLGAAAAIGIGGALFFALKPQHQTTGSELYNTNNRNTPDGLANLPRDYTGLPKPAAPARAATAWRPRAADPECRRARARHADAGGGTKPRGTAYRAGAGGGAGEPSLCHEQ